jgi:hypothetical protein
MRRRPSMLVTATALAIIAVLVAGCEAKVYGAPGSKAPQATVVAPEGPVLAPAAPPPRPTAAFDGLDARVRKASQEAASKGATISVVILDRATNQLVTNGNSSGLAIASVAKLYIADDLLLQEAQGRTVLSPADRSAMDTMLRSSDDNAAEAFWNRGGGGAIITRVAARYGLSSTAPPGNGRWWNTVSSAADLVRYYDKLLDGSGGLPPERANIIMNNLARSTPTGIDGYPQRFGIPDGLYAEPVAVKQGWMCCIGADWMHLSTGVIGTDRRYVMAIGSEQPTSDDAARATITNAVKTMFPSGKI